MTRDPGVRTYDRASVAAFLRTSERFGGLSNMARGFPLRVGDREVSSSEHFYQAMRFPHRQSTQGAILCGKTPIDAKRTAQARSRETRDDWYEVNIAIMRHALRLKFACNPSAIRRIMDDTGDSPIVEISRRDDFWGTFETGDRLIGRNVLGRLLMELREVVRDTEPGEAVEVTAPDISGYTLLGDPVESAHLSPPAGDAPELDL